MAPLPGGHKLPYMAKMVINGRLVHSFPFPIKISKIVRCYGDDHGDGEDNLITTSATKVRAKQSTTKHHFAPAQIFALKSVQIFASKSGQVLV